MSLVMTTADGNAALSSRVLLSHCQINPCFNNIFLSIIEKNSSRFAAMKFLCLHGAIGNAEVSTQKHCSILGHKCASR